MLKPRFRKIIGEFFAIGGNHDLPAYQKSRIEILDFLREEDIMLLPWDDENIVLGKDLIHYIDATINFSETTNREEAYRFLKPFLDRMLETDENNWHYYHLKLIVSCLGFTDTIEDALLLEKKILHRAAQFSQLRDTQILEAVTACQMGTRILEVKLFEQNVSDKLERKFKNQIRKLKDLTDADKSLEFYWYLGRIRWEIFNGHLKSARNLCDELESYADKRVAQMMRKEVEIYSAKLPDNEENAS